MIGVSIKPVAQVAATTFEYRFPEQAPISCSLATRRVGIGRTQDHVETFARNYRVRMNAIRSREEKYVVSDEKNERA